MSVAYLSDLESKIQLYHIYENTKSFLQYILHKNLTQTNNVLNVCVSFPLQNFIYNTVMRMSGFLLVSLT
jgi:hypothetical protein